MEKTCVYKNNQCIYKLSDTCENEELIKNIQKMIGEADLEFLTCDDNYILVLLDKLGEGGFNKAYRVIESTSGREYVLRLTIEESYDKDVDQMEKLGLYLQAYFSKTKSEGGLHCPYIAKVYSFGEYEKRNNNLINQLLSDSNKKGVFGLIEYVKGGELLDRIDHKFKTGTKFTEKDISKLMFRLLTSLNCIHSHNFVHLDLKPSNILMVSNDNDYDIKLIDFGFVKYIENIRDGINPIEFGRGGTPGYKAPEVNVGKTCGTKADIWGVGIILINMLLLETDFRDVSKFPGDFYETLIPNIFFKVYKKQLLQEYSKECIDFLTKILKLEPAERMSTVECLNHRWIKKYNKSYYITKNTNKKTKMTKKQTKKNKDILNKTNLRKMKKNELIEILVKQGKETDGIKEILINRILND